MAISERRREASVASDTSLETIEKELVMIRKLLIFALHRTGASQQEIAVALGVNQSSVSRMFPKTTNTKRPSR